jgi:metal-sulfur cluster biosynthetic enzyme
MEIISNDPAKCSIAITGLNQVDDPEIYQIDFDESDKKIYIQMTFSTPFCPMGDSIIFEVKQKMLENFSEYDIIINLSFDPPWSPDRISAKGKEFLNK